jgi:hypothetical protein
MKPTLLFSNRKFITEVLHHAVDRHDTPPLELVRRFVDKDGRPRFTGNDQLKSSQVSALLKMLARFGKRASGIALRIMLA